MELPALDAGLETRASYRLWEYDRPQAGRANAADRIAPGRAGHGRENGATALELYTGMKTVTINLGCAAVGGRRCSMADTMHHGWFDANRYGLRALAQVSFVITKTF